MTLIPRILLIGLSILPVLAGAEPRTLRMHAPPVQTSKPDPKDPKLTLAAESALKAFSELTTFKSSYPNICLGGARAWAKVYASQLAYRDVGRAVYEIGDACSDVGSEDVLAVQTLIPKRIKRLEQSEAFKAQCLDAWMNRIVVEKAFIKGPEKIIEEFQSNCYQAQTENSGSGAGAR